MQLTITITTQPDGTFTVDLGDGQPAATVESVDALQQLLADTLGGGAHAEPDADDRGGAPDGDADDMRRMWDEEAQRRPATGLMG